MTPTTRRAAALALDHQDAVHALAIGGLLGAGLLNAAYFIVFVLV
jgi:hypothetical protein